MLPEELARFLVKAQQTTEIDLSWVAVDIGVTIVRPDENSTVSVDRLFTDKYVHLWKSQGWPDCAAIFFAALIG